MNTIQNLFQQAQFAEAAYANFINQSTGLLYDTQGDIEDALEASGFSPAQASEFVENWRIVDQMTSSLTGFSATVFERLDENGDGTGEYSFAIRGSTPEDFIDDYLFITSDGIAVSQLKLK